jgi:GNAT superfamily N-acetyltransferase
VFVADRGDGSLAGFVEVGARPYADGCATSPVGYIEAWYVDADVRRRGVGRALLAAAEEWARGRGYREMASDATLDNVVSHAAHARAGYEEVDRVVQFRKPLGDPGRAQAVRIAIVVVTGASGAGKTATVAALQGRGLPGVQCFHFDSIGVPSLEVMEREYGGPERWQAWATNEWLRRLAAVGNGVHVAILDAQTRPSTVVAAPGAGTAWRGQVVLLDCSPEVRAARLRGPRGQGELATARMDAWAAYLRGQADALGLPVIDTSELTIAAAADQLERIVRETADPARPAV